MKHLTIPRLLVAVTICVAGAQANAAPANKASAPIAKPAAAPTPALPSEPVVAPAPPLPVFSFQGEDSETEYPIRKYPQSYCEMKMVEGTTEKYIYCPYRDASIAGKDVSLYKQYYWGKLYSIYAIFSPDTFTTIMSAFVEKYGRPNKSEVEK